ncbi:hypothetical protein [Peribacillus muralis]|uniref:hypothetical protein n=1 Tax=Peribacillus muralis TaxID=264697 RepID=UPI003CFC9CD6
MSVSFHFRRSLSAGGRGAPGSYSRITQKLTRNRLKFGANSKLASKSTKLASKVDNFASKSDKFASKVVNFASKPLK